MILGGSSAIFSVLLASVLLFIAYKILKVQKISTRKAREFLFNVTNAGKEEPILIGHRAGQYEAAENTLIAIKTAHKNNAHAVELDLDFTEDKYGILIHDETVDRTTNGSGVVSEFRFHELRKLDAAYKMKMLRFADGTLEQAGFEQIPTLKEAVELCLKLKMKIILDVKSNAALTANLLSKLSKEFPELKNMLMVKSFYPSIIYAVKRKCPYLLTALLWRHDYASLTVEHKPRFTGLTYMLVKVVDFVGYYLVHSLLLPDFLGIEAVSMNKDHISQRYVKQWRSKGFEIMSWTVNNPLEKEYFLKKLEVPIITDSILNNEECPEQQF
eukprot:gene8768-9705_t